jgi:hypothetical protein
VLTPSTNLGTCSVVTLGDCLCGFIVRILGGLLRRLLPDISSAVLGCGCDLMLLARLIHLECQTVTLLTRVLRV